MWMSFVSLAAERVLQAVHSVRQEVLFMTDEEKKDYVSDQTNQVACPTSSKCPARACTHTHTHADTHTHARLRPAKKKKSNQHNTQLHGQVSDQHTSITSTCSIGGQFHKPFALNS